MKKTFILILLLLLSISLLGCNKTTISSSANTTTKKETTTILTTTVIHDDDSEFRSFADEFLLALVDDPSMINQLFKDPSIIGYERDVNDKASYQIYESYEKDQSEDYEFITSVLEELSNFDRSMLSPNQTLEYDVIDDFCQVELLACKPEVGWYIITYPFIDKYGGSVANVSSEIENYDINDEQDIIDIIDYLDSTVLSFASYEKYLEDRIRLGFEYSDYTLDSMIEYLDGLLSRKDDYYLNTVLENNINSVDFINDEKKEVYILDAKRAIKESFMKACEDLIPVLEKYKGHWVNATESYIAHYGSKCAGYKEYELMSVIGYDKMSSVLMSEYPKGYRESYNAYMAIEEKISEKGSIFKKKVSTMISNKSNFLGATSIDELIPILMRESEKVVKPLNNVPTVKTKFCDETVQEFAEYSAYYVLSAFDEKNSPIESITVNPANFDSLGDAIFTLAHEGYPGHLYSHAYQKENDVPMLVFGLSRNGVNEAWAQYAAYKTLLSASESLNDEITSFALKFIANETYVNYVYSGYIDYVVNYRGYSVDRLIKEGMASSKADAMDLIHFCDENPGTFTGYGLLFYSLVRDHEELKATMSGYNELEFNSFIMLNGGLYSTGFYNKALSKYKALY